MLDILGTKYLSEKEVAHRYGYSQSWFRKRRWKNEEPAYIKFDQKGRILYPLDKTDEWFKKKLREGA